VVGNKRFARLDVDVVRAAAFACNPAKKARARGEVDLGEV